MMKARFPFCCLCPSTAAASRERTAAVLGDLDSKKAQSVCPTLQTTPPSSTRFVTTPTNPKLLSATSSLVNQSHCLWLALTVVRSPEAPSAAPPLTLATCSLNRVSCVQKSIFPGHLLYTCLLLRQPTMPAWPATCSSSRQAPPIAAQPPLLLLAC
jgi:hypothetical protein